MATDKTLIRSRIPHFETAKKPEPSAQKQGNVSNEPELKKSAETAPSLQLETAKSEQQSPVALLKEKLAHQGIVLNHKDLQELEAYLQKNPLKTQGDLKSLLTLIARGLPLHPKLMDLIRRFQEGALNLTEKVQKGNLELKEKGLKPSSILNDVQKFLLESGINTEARLLKGEDAQAKLFENLGQEIQKELKDALTAQQVLNQDEETPLLFFLPFVVEDEAREIVLKYRKKPNHQGQEGGHSLHLNLYMSQMGELDLGFFLNQGNLMVQLASDTEKGYEVLLGSTEQVQEALQDLGLFTTVQVGVLYKTIRRPNAEEFTPSGGVDVLI